MTAATRPTGPAARPGSERPVEREGETLLRFVVCGSVDDGKSTLVGRLLYECGQLYADQLDALTTSSGPAGLTGSELDFASLLDGLAAEREQGITIDVAYRFFATPKRRFIVADAPGHEQYTRNMVTGASTADLAVILVDARKGVLPQTRRHTHLVALLGVGDVILAVNKLDLAGYEQNVYQAIAAGYTQFAAAAGIRTVTAIPCCATRGENVASASTNTPWYRGPSLVEALEAANTREDHHAAPFRLAVQLLNRPQPGFRGLSGQITSGSISSGDRVRIAPSGAESAVARIITYDGELPSASAGQAVTITLTDEIDVGRGDLVTSAREPVQVASQLELDVVWMAQQPMLPGRQYLVKLATRTVPGRLSAPEYRLNINTLERLPAATLSLNEIGACVLTLEQPVPFEPYRTSRQLGGLILIDRVTNDTVAAGMIRTAVEGSQNIRWQHLDVTKASRSALNSHKPAAIWLTGLSGAGKSTIANLVEGQLHAAGVRTYLLDGDNIRHGLSRDLGFTDPDRIENMRRVAEVAKLMVDAGLIVLVAFISPFTQERAAARAMFEPDEFIEVHVDAPLEVVQARDTKGLYAKARAGELSNLTGVDSPYEAPIEPDVSLQTAQRTPEECAHAVIAELRNRGLIEHSTP